jgi:hypothetical protein
MCNRVHMIASKVWLATSGMRRFAALLAPVAASTLVGSCLDSFDPEHARFSLSPRTATILIADTVRLIVTSDARAPRGALRAQWSSSDVAVATADTAGLMRGVGPGTTVVRAALFDTVLTATVRVTDMMVQPQNAQVLEDDTLRLTATVVDTRGDTLRQAAVLWRSADTAVAHVDSTGVVLGRREGIAEVTATSGTSSATSDVHVAARVLVGAGDIADCQSSGDEATAALLDTIPGVVFTLGDNAYQIGSDSDFANCYAPSWGRHRDRTRPSPGNHDYMTSRAWAYFEYFGANAGSPDRGYYSYDYGPWHVVVLNSSIDVRAGSPQLQWLATDLATHKTLCTLAYFHFPLFSSGAYGNAFIKSVWHVLYQGGVDVVLSGHDHIYERFAPQDPDGREDLVRGIRQFTVGTGGRYLHSIVSQKPNSEVHSTTTFGVLKLSLHRTGYDWHFIPIAGQSFTDSGSAPCH